MLCIGVKKIKIHFDTSQLCCGVVHSIKTRFLNPKFIFPVSTYSFSVQIIPEY
jgi:hypothetical protein